MVRSRRWAEPAVSWKLLGGNETQSSVVWAFWPIRLLSSSGYFIYTCSHFRSNYQPGFCRSPWSSDKKSGIYAKDALLRVVQRLKLASTIVQTRKDLGLYNLYCGFPWFNQHVSVYLLWGARCVLIWSDLFSWVVTSLLCTHVTCGLLSFCVQVDGQLEIFSFPSPCNHYSAFLFWNSIPHTFCIVWWSVQMCTGSFTIVTCR